MSTPCELEVSFEYEMDTTYGDILLKGDWVRGLPVSFSVTIKNKSPGSFPGYEVQTKIVEHSSLNGSDSIYAWPSRRTGRIEYLESFTLAKYNYKPVSEGVCEIILQSKAFDREELILKEYLERTGERNVIKAKFTVIGWQELEIINLLKQLNNKIR